MPTRLIREGILSSDRVDKLGDAAEVFYRRLLSKVDDHGLFDGRPSVLIAGLYPLRLQTSVNKCLQMLAECVAANLVQVYEIDGKRFIKCLDTRWKVRSEPRFPLPVNGVKYVSSEQLFTTVSLVVDVVEVVGVVKPARKTKGADKPSGAETWAAYSAAYATRYGIEPVRNAKVNGLISKFVQAVGAQDAPDVAAFYVSLNSSWYVGKGHAVQFLLADAEKIRTEWATGTQITQTAAHQSDKLQATGSIYKKLMRENDDEKSH